MSIVTFRQYYLDENRQRRGLILGEVDPQTKKIRIGWSYRSRRDRRSNPELGEKIATNRLAACREIQNGIAEYVQTETSMPQKLKDFASQTIQNRIFRILNPRPKGYS